jgi:protein-L-isoaspartate(D-aspartate) O-methyltransferase
MEHPAASGDRADGAASDAESLNRTLVDALVKSEHVRSPRIEEAFRSLYRHHFLPELPLETVYRDEAIMTRIEGNIPLSSSSQPAMMAIMLEQLDLQPGERVLEIGTATGYNAAIMARLVGPSGHVVSVDIDPELVGEAKKNLEHAGVANVSAFASDGGYGYPDMAPYDAIVLTVGSWDIAPAWIEQLAPDGRLLLPLALFGDYQESILFRRENDHLVSSSHYCCSFVRLRGAFAGPEGRTIDIEPGLKLLLEHDDFRPFEPASVRAMLDVQRTDIPTGVSLRLRVVHSRLLRALSTRRPDLCSIVAEGMLADSGIVPFLFGAPGKVAMTMGIIDDGSLALLLGDPANIGSTKPSEEPFELVVRCYGRSDEPGRVLVEEIRRWDDAGRPCEDPGLTIRAYPKEHPVTPAPGERIIEKERTRLVLSWNAQ